MNVLSLFDGIACGRLALQRANIQVDTYYASEIEKSSIKVALTNFPDIIEVGDVRNLNTKDFKDIDLMIWGSPCQNFSMAGKRQGMTTKDKITIDTLDKYLYYKQQNYSFEGQSYLFWEAIRLLKEIKPKYFLIENVPNILTAENGLFKNEIVNLFESIGYSVNCAILKASDYGVPQDRRRAIIIGRQGNLKPNLPKATNELVTIYDAISDLEYLNSGEGEEEQKYLMPPKSKYQKVMRKNSKILYNHIATKHSTGAIEKLKMIPPGRGKEVLPKSMLTKSIYSGTWSRMLYNEQSVTITTRFDTPSSGRFTHPILNRCITVREAARIQSFPDDFVFYGSKNSQMKQVGNAVPPKLGKAIAEEILEHL